MAFPPAGERSSGDAYVVFSATCYVVDISIATVGNVLEVVRMRHYDIALRSLATSQPRS